LQELTGRVRAAMERYRMVEPGDKIGVGVSGGKDSLALLCALAELRRCYPVPYTLTALAVDPCFYGKAADYSQIRELCRRLGVPLVVRQTELYHVVFEQRGESNPCSLCARMRRGMLHNMALASGCSRVALGHHADDAVETFLMNLLQGGRIGCFSPKSYLSRKGLWMIRPMVFLREKEVAAAARRHRLPVLTSRCPADGNTARAGAKDLAAALRRSYPDLDAKILGAMQRAGLDHWGVE
jgi:tRNA 2-thiocytidine biosynthesis protein TtcA